MKKIITLLLLALILEACSKVPLTGRRQLNLLPESQMIGLSFSTYDAFLQENPISTNATWTAMVQDVGKEISASVTEYMNANGLEDRIRGFDWEYKLIAEETVNAWCMPGGKIAFYEGIMPVCATKAGVAVVMGHEVAHAIARHGNERMSQGLALQAGGMALDVALANEPETTRAIFLGAYGAGANLGVLLPFSRKHESEADRLGLIFMAKAGYDPNEAVAFWTRMDELSAGAEPPEFLSTHPNHDTRIKDIQKWMPEAMKFYAPQKNSLGF